MRDKSVSKNRSVTSFGKKKFKNSKNKSKTSKNIKKLYVLLRECQER